MCWFFIYFFASASDPQAKAPDMVDEMLVVHCLFDEVVTLFYSIAMISHSDSSVEVCHV